MKFLMILAAVPLLGHTLYFLPVKFRLAKGEDLGFSLHNGDAFPASEDAVAPARLLDARLIGPEKTTPVADFRKLGKATHSVVKAGESGSHWLAVRTRPNLITLEAPKFEQYLKDEGLDSVLQWRNHNSEAAKAGRERYTKYAKSLVVVDRPSEHWSRNLGLLIEFVLEADPSTLRPGDLLPARLLWHGKPAAGVRVEKAWAADGKHGVEVVGRAGADGRINIRIDRAGRWRLHAVAMERLNGVPEADWESFWATLTFELK